MIPDANASASSALELRGRRWLGWLGLAVALVALGYYLVALRAQAATLQQIVWGRSAIAWLLLCIGIYPLTYWAGALIWCLILRAVGARLELRRAAGICAVSQFGKYLPGNVAHHVGRVALARREGLSVDHIVASLLFETANVLLAGTLGAGLLLKNESAAVSVLSGGVPILGIGVAVVLVVCAVLVMLWRRYRQGQPQRTAVELRWLPICFGLQCGAFVVHGAIVVLLVRGVLGMPQGSVAVLTGAFALAWVAGFVTPGAPAGVGIREAVISLGLAPSLGTGGAVAVAGLLRLVSVCGDLATFGAGLVLERANRRAR